MPRTEETTENQPTPHVHFPLEAMVSSTLFIDHNLRIEWVKTKKSDRLSNAISDEWQDDPSGTVFDILLRASLKELVFNWQPLFTFVYRFLQKTTSKEIFNRLAPTLSTGIKEITPKIISGQIRQGQIDSAPIRLEDEDGQMQDRRIYGLVLSEGTLFILNKDRQASRKTGADRHDRQPASDDDTGKIPFSVLSARLDDSRGIVDTMLPEAYYQLMTRIWDECDGILASYAGRRAKRSGIEVQYIISQQGETDPAYDAICCAIELKKKMREIEATLKSEKGWFSRIRLNIGISSGRDHVEESDPTAGMAFILPGGAADQANYLSAISSLGSIWITKSAFSHIASHLTKRITFGIYHNQKLIPRIFAKVSDLRHSNSTSFPEKGMRSMAVTRIISLRNA